MRVPYGIRTTEDGAFVAFVYGDEPAGAALAVVPPVWCADDLRQLGDAELLDEDEDVFAEYGETFRCLHCGDAWTFVDECDVYKRMCVGCCGHAACLEHFQERIALPTELGGGEW